MIGREVYEFHYFKVLSLLKSENLAMNRSCEHPFIITGLKKNRSPLVVSLLSWLQTSLRETETNSRQLLKKRILEEDKIKKQRLESGCINGQKASNHPM
jgi:hypothetical protein